MKFLKLQSAASGCIGELKRQKSTVPTVVHNASLPHLATRQLVIDKKDFDNR